MKFKHVIGLDMAKEGFVLAIHDHPYEQVLKNDKRGIRKMLKVLVRVLDCSLEECLFCLEHTGMYSMEMMEQLSQRALPFVMISGLELKKSQGIKRGKSDSLDARKIAEFGYLRQSKLVLHHMPGKTLQHLKQLLSLRAMHVRHRASYKARLGEQSRVLKKTEYSLVLKSQQRMIRQFDKEIEKIEASIENLIESDDQIKRCYDLLVSIHSIGPVIATQMIVKTCCFLTFSDWRKFACYCGTAPFPNESGKKIGKHKISKIGDKEIKRLLTLAARNARRHDPEIRMYSDRKLKEGKTDKNVINAVRNKLLARMFSVVKRGTPYVQMMKYAS